MSTMPTITDQVTDELFLSVLEKFLSGLDAEKQQQFLTWFEAHKDDADFFTHLIQSYAQFGEHFTDAIEKFGMSTTGVQSNTQSTAE